MRLNVFIAKGGQTSRRKADNLIKEGKVKINGVTVITPFYQVTPRDVVELEGKPIRFGKFVYLILNKPAGVTSTVKDQFAEKTVCEGLPEKYKGVYPVGRLDCWSSGLIVLTNDGELCYRATHPKFELEKEYLVSVRGIAEKEQVAQAKKGVLDEGEFLKVKRVSILRLGDNDSLLKVVITEGKKRHLRRLFGSLGLTVINLKRVRMGGLMLGDLKLGEYKELSRKDIYALLFGRQR